MPLNKNTLLYRHKVYKHTEPRIRGLKMKKYDGLGSWAFEPLEMLKLKEAS